MVRILELAAVAGWMTMLVVLTPTATSAFSLWVAPTTRTSAVGTARSFALQPTTRTAGRRAGSSSSFDLHHNNQRHSQPLTPLYLSGAEEGGSNKDDDEKSKLPFFLDANTKGGALVLMVVLFVVPYLGYQVMVNTLGYDEIDAGIAVGMGFTVFSTLAWMSTYLFRVATKDMTYVSWFGGVVFLVLVEHHGFAATP